MKQLVRSFLSLWLAGSVLSAAAQPSPPTVVSEEEVFRLRASTPADCASIAKGPYAIVLSLGRLEAFAKGRPASWKTEQERLALIAGDRARALTAVIGAEIDPIGCRRASRAVPVDAEYLLLSELRSGEVAVIDRRSGAFVDHLDARTSGFRCGGPPCGGRGDMAVSVPGDGTLLLMLNLWVS